MQTAKIAVDGTARPPLTGVPVNAFFGCPHSRPTDIMKWWRAKQPKPAPEPRAPATEAVREATPTPAPPVPPTAPKAASAAPDRVHSAAADRAEVATLRAEVGRLKNRLAALEAENDQNIDDYNELLETHNELEKLFSMVLEAVEATGLSVVNESADRAAPKLIIADYDKAIAWFEEAKEEI